MNKVTKTRLHPYQSALLEIGVMFLPGIPAYIWLWPNMEGRAAALTQIGVYLYFLAGCLIIGLRRWNLGQLGLNRQGLGLSLACGALIVIGRVVIMLSVDWGAPPLALTFWGLLGDIAFYFGLIGLIEELLFRGLMYRALDEWGSARLAIWGTTLAFGLYHLGSQGPLGVLAGVLMGAVLAVIRWRAGSIVGLIFTHGMIDVTSKVMLPEINPRYFGQIEIISRGWLLVGYALILIVPLYLWKLWPLLQHDDDQRRKDPK